MADIIPLSFSLHGGCTNGDTEAQKDEQKLELAAPPVNLKSVGLKKKLLVLDLNGLLIHRTLQCNKSEIPQNRSPDFVYKRRCVYKRPFLEEFVNFCLQRFEVGIWSSGQERNVSGVLDNILKGLKKKLLFVWDQDRCRDSGFKSLEKKHKPLFLKDLNVLWQSSSSTVNGGDCRFSESNTLLIDDEPYKALLNPPNTGIFPVAYDAANLSDNVLGPKGELCRYLEGLVYAEDVPSYVKAHPFAQPAIGPQHPNWDFYSIVLSHSRICQAQQLVLATL